MTGQPPTGSILNQSPAMKFQRFTFGQIRIDGFEYGYDVVIDRGRVGKREKKAFENFRKSFVCTHHPNRSSGRARWHCSNLAEDGDVIGAIIAT